ncbi:testis-expressed protein 47-like [Gastrophryne carolinensis]
MEQLSQSERRRARCRDTETVSKLLFFSPDSFSLLFAMEAGKSREHSLKEASTPEKAGSSYFHQLLHKRLLLNPRDDTKSILQRLIFVSRISPDLADKKELGEWWEQRLQLCSSGEPVGGLLLLYPACSIHVLEASGDALYHVLRDLQRTTRQKEDRKLLLDSRILVMSHNLPTRLFHQWNYKVQHVPGQSLGDRYSEEEPDAIITECLHKMLRTGKHLNKYPKGSRNLPDSVLEKIPDLLVPPASIMQLLQSHELLTPEQFLRIYDSPLHVAMDSDCVWPTPGHLRPMKGKSGH